MAQGLWWQLAVSQRRGGEAWTQAANPTLRGNVRQYPSTAETLSSLAVIWYVGRMKRARGVVDNREGSAALSVVDPTRGQDHIAGASAVQPGPALDQDKI